MTKKFILLNPLDCKSLVVNTPEEIIEALEEFGCKAVFSYSNTHDETFIYASADTKEAIEAMVDSVDLDGIIVEYTGVFDNIKM